MLGIINFDAHFDLRDHAVFSSSGTPFSQAAEDCFLNEKVFSYICYGISRASNTRILFKKANDLNVQYLLDTDLNMGQREEFDQSIQNFIANCDFIYLTIDLDVFPAEVAPGVSAPATLGIPLDLVLHAINVLKLAVRKDGSPKLLLADICELNPRFDIDNHTSKVAARLCYHLLADSN